MDRERPRTSWPGAPPSSRPNAKHDALPNSAKASLHYGAIRASLEKAGRPIGVNGLHIAAHARSEGRTLVTNNLGEFERVPGLLRENWVDGLA